MLKPENHFFLSRWAFVKSETENQDFFFFQLKVLLLSIGQDDPGIQLKLEKKIGPVCEEILDTL